MPRHRYRAIDGAGRTRRGTVVAFDEADVEDRLKTQGLTLVAVKTLPEDRRTVSLGWQGVKPRALLEFYYRFSQTLQMGLPILSGLDENARVIPSKPLKKIIENIRGALEDGNTLHDAMARFPRVFAELDLGIIRMGERAGILEQCMRELGDFLAWKEDLRSTVSRALIYPALILLILPVVIGVWLVRVLPPLASVLLDLGVPLPGPTQAMLALSDFIRSPAMLWTGGSMFLIVALLYGAQRTQRAGLLLHKYLLKVPFVGPIARDMACARLTRHFGTMQSAGMSINQIFSILSENVLGNRYLEAQVAAAYQELQLGRTFGEALHHVEGFPPLLVGGIQHGEVTGQLESTLRRLSDYYDSEVRRSVQNLLSALGPFTVLIMGSVFALIILSIILPILDAITKLQGSY